MKILIKAMLVAAIFSPYAIADQSKYSRNDCITPTEDSYSWYGKVAIVEAYTVIEGISSNKAYVLAFPHTGSRSAIFEKAIEASTKKVDRAKCGYESPPVC